MRRMALLAAGAIFPLAAWAQPAPPPSTGSAVGYPNNPQGTPQAQNGGAPVRTDRAACPAGTACPASPPLSAAADTGTTAAPAAGGVRIPSTAYPDSPVQTPGADPSGQAPRR